MLSANQSPVMMATDQSEPRTPAPPSKQNINHDYLYLVSITVSSEQRGIIIIMMPIKYT